RDAYGFKRPVEWVDIQELETFQVYYQRILARQAEKWRGYMKENKGHWPSKDAKLIRYARKGIPQELRAKAWLHYSGAQHKMDTCVGHYEELLQQAEEMGDRNEYADIIQRDLHRTFPDNSHFCCAVSQEDGSVTMDPSTNDHLQKLKRVLLAFSLYLPQVGYCQSLNFLAGYFILLLEEEEAFWLLVMTITEYFPPGMFDSSLEGATIEQAVLMQSIYEKMPGVWNKIANKRCFWECEQTNRLPSITLVTGHWFMTLFINILPVETVLRVWDSLYM
ncbi:rab-GTPase-TBC domain-containing protein, partial [Radiomyces spectabilis]|uniref:rab-GTPase-TBC domain-containing protein n=1 Tax=Radiomyces spectabilis TaxID=64574 RepID=UPI00221F547D